MLNPIHMMQKSVLSRECCGLTGNVFLYTLVTFLHYPVLLILNFGATEDIAL